MIAINYKCHSCNKNSKMTGQDAANFLCGKDVKEIPKGWSKGVMVVNNFPYITNVYFCDKCTIVRNIMK